MAVTTNVFDGVEQAKQLLGLCRMTSPTDEQVQDLATTLKTNFYERKVVEYSNPSFLEVVNKVLHDIFEALGCKNLSQKHYNNVVKLSTERKSNLVEARTELVGDKIDMAAAS